MSEHGAVDFLTERTALVKQVLEEVLLFSSQLMDEMITHACQSLQRNERLVHDSRHVQAAKAKPIGNDLRIEAVRFIQVGVRLFEFANKLWIDGKHLEILPLEFLQLVEKHRRMPVVDPSSFHPDRMVALVGPQEDLIAKEGRAKEMVVHLELGAGVSFLIHDPRVQICRAHVNPDVEFHEIPSVHCRIVGGLFGMPPDRAC